MANFLTFLPPIANNTKEMVKELRKIRKILEESNTLQTLPGDPNSE